MARRRLNRNWADVPQRVRDYDPRVHGEGVAGITAWQTEARLWLVNHPGRSLPCGSDVLSIYRRACRLIDRIPPPE